MRQHERTGVARRWGEARCASGRICAAAFLAGLLFAGAAMAQTDAADVAYKLIFADLAKKHVEYRKARVNSTETGLFGDLYPAWSAKAIAVCVDWPNATPQSIPVKHWAFRFDEGGAKGASSQQRVTESTLSRCRERAGANPDCECQLLDEGGINHLGVPPDYAEKLRAKGS